MLKNVNILACINLVLSVIRKLFAKGLMLDNECNVVYISR